MMIVIAELRVLFRTLRRRFEFAQPDASLYLPVSGSTDICCVRHVSPIFPLFAGRQSDTTAIVSRHGDGNSMACLLQGLGIGSVRGSNFACGVKVLRKILDQGSTGHFVLTPDGPRGPRRQMKQGYVIASRFANGLDDELADVLLMNLREVAADENLSEDCDREPVSVSQAAVEREISR